MKPRHVSIADAVRLELRQIGQQCQQMGRSIEFARAAAHIAKGLAVKPLPPEGSADVFGCPLYHLTNLGLLVCVAAVAPISLLFAVAEPRPQQNGADPATVYVMRFRLMF